MSEKTLRRFAPTVTVADGRTFKGLWPQQCAPNHESPYADALAELVSGVREVSVPAGRADVMTPTVAYEVEPAANWKAGLRQALAYAAATGTTPGLALFGEADYAKIYGWFRKELPIVELWRWDGSWKRLTSMSFAKTATAALPLARPTKITPSVAPAPRIRPSAPGIRALDDPLTLERAARLVRRVLARQAGAQ